MHNALCIFLLVKKIDIKTLKKVTKTTPNVKLLTISANNVTDLLVNLLIYGNIL